MTPAAIDGRGLTKQFGAGDVAVHALRGVDLRVERGEVVMLVGPSGSGKTTLLSIIGCVLTASAGQLEVFGHRITGRSERELPLLRRALFGFVFQGHNLVGSLTALDNIALVQRIRGVERSLALTDARELLERIGLAEKLHRRPAELSGGEAQRVAVARAIVGSPPLLLADEPTASLDAASGRRVTELIRDLARERGSTALIVTHDQRIFEIADRIIHIEDGLLRDGRREEAG